MRRLEMKNYYTILTDKQKKYNQHYDQVKLINMNILQVKNITSC